MHSDKNVDMMRQVAKELQMPWIVAQDKDGNTTMKSFGGDSFPDYYLIDRSGKLRFADLANAEVERAVEMLIKEKG